MVRKQSRKIESDSDSEGISDTPPEMPSGALPEMTSRALPLNSGSANVVQVGGGLGVISGFFMIPYVAFKQMGWVISVMSMVGLVVVTLFVENFCRRTLEYNHSLLRPSVMISELDSQFRSLFNWLGFQFARITNIFYWVYEYLVEDLVNIINPLGHLMFSWMQFFKGYMDYYLSGLTWVMPGLGIIGSVLVVSSVFCAVNYYYFGNFLNCEILRISSDWVKAKIILKFY